MSKDIRNRSVTGRLHRVVYRAIVGLAILFALAVWGFASDGYTDYLLVVVTGFIVMAVAVPSALSWAWRKSRKPGEGAEESFGDWAAGEFDTWQDRLPAKSAAVEILLPLAAAAFGMMLFGIVFHMSGHA